MTPASTLVLQPTSIPCACTPSLPPHLGTWWVGVSQGGGTRGSATHRGPLPHGDHHSSQGSEEGPGGNQLLKPCPQRSQVEFRTPAQPCPTAHPSQELEDGQGPHSVIKSRKL